MMHIDNNNLKFMTNVLFEMGGKLEDFDDRRYSHRTMLGKELEFFPLAGCRELPRWKEDVNEE